MPEETDPKRVECCLLAVATSWRIEPDELGIAHGIRCSLCVDDEDARRTIEGKLCAEFRDRCGSCQTGQTRDTALAPHDDGIPAGRAREAIHRRDRISLVDCHEGVGGAREHTPGHTRRLVAFEHRHHRRLAMRDLHQVTGLGRLEEAGGTRGLDHDKSRSVVTKGQGEIAGNSGCDTADTGLHEDMRWRIGKLAQGFMHDCRVALHDQQGDALVTRPGRIGDDGPTFFVGDARRFDHRVVVGTFHANHLGAEAGDCGDASVADAAMDEDHGTSAHESGSLCDRAAMIAVGGAGKGHGGRDGFDRRIVQLADIDGAAQPARRFLEDQPDDGIGASERLETAEAKALAFVLHVERGETKLCSEARQRMQRCFGMVVPMAEEALDLAGGCDAEGFRIDGIELRSVVGMVVGEEHGTPHLAGQRKSIARNLKRALYFSHLFASLVRRERILTQPSPAAVSLDRFDLAIIGILQKDNTTPQRVIGEAVNLSAPAVQRRIKRLEEAGVIQAHVAVIDPATVGHPITIFVEVEMESERADLIDTAKREFTAAPEVQQCYYVTGEADFILIMLVPTMAAYETVTRRLFFGNNNVKRFRTFVAMDRVKVGLAVPIPG